MARYQNSMQTPKPAEFYAPAINQYMTNENFKLVDYKGLKVWKRGSGWLTAPQYISVQYKDNVIYLEAFIRNAILPGVYVGETGLSGFYGALPKHILKEKVCVLEKYISDLWQDASRNQTNTQQ